MFSSSEYFDRVGMIDPESVYSISTLMVNSGYWLGYRQERIELEMRRFIRHMYDFLILYDKNIDFSVDEDATLDEIMLLLMSEITEKTSYFVDITTKIHILDYRISNSYFGQLHLKQFYDLRKHKKEYISGLKFLKALNDMGVSLFDNGVSQMVFDMANDLEEEPNADYKYFKHVRKTKILIDSVLNDMKCLPLGDKLTKWDIKRISKHDYRWKEYLEDIYELHKMDFHVTELFGSAPEDPFSTVLYLDDCFQFMWEGTYSDNAYDNEVSQHMDSHAADSEIVEPAIGVELNMMTLNKNIFKILAKNKMRAEKYFKLYSENYAIYRD